MNSEAQQFCLRWHNYSTSLLASLPRLLDWDDLTDVTLYAGGLSVKAHRIVLSACSQYFKAIFKSSSQTPDNSSLPVPLKIMLITTSLEDVARRFSDCGNEIVVHAFVYDRDGKLYKEKLPRGYEITWNCHMRVHPICAVRGRNQLTAVFNDLNCGHIFSPLLEIYHEKTNYVKHASLKPIQIGQAAKNCTMTLECVELCEKELDPGKALKINIQGVNNSHALREPVFGVSIYNGLNGDLIYVGSTFWRLTVMLSPIPVYYKYKMIVATKPSMINESCSAMYNFETKKVFAVGIQANPPAPLRYEGPRRVPCGGCVALTPYCIHGWLVDPKTCGLQWKCSDAACGMTEGYDTLLLKKLPCGINFTVILEGDPFARAAHTFNHTIYEWRKIAALVLTVGPELFPHHRRSIPAEGPTTKQTTDWSSSISGLPGEGHSEGLYEKFSADVSVGSCDSIVEFHPEYILYSNSSLIVLSEI